MWHIGKPINDKGDMVSRIVTRVNRYVVYITSNQRIYNIKYNVTLDLNITTTLIKTIESKESRHFTVDIHSDYNH